MDSGGANGSGEKKADARDPKGKIVTTNHGKAILIGCQTVRTEYEEVERLVGITPERSLFF